MRPLAYGSEPVKSGYAERSRKVAIRPAPGRRFFQFHPQFGRQALSLPKERSHPSSAFEGRTVHTPAHLNPAALIEGLERPKLAIQVLCVRCVGRADVDFDPALRRDHIAAGSTVNQSRAEPD